MKVEPTLSAPKTVFIKNKKQFRFAELLFALSNLLHSFFRTGSLAEIL